MSEVFEVILLPFPFQEAQQAVKTLPSPLNLKVERMDDLCVVFRNESGRPEFSPEIDQTAAALSAKVGKALVVRYDSRIAHRTAALFVKGNMEKAFGEDDEVWVLLDDQGKKILDGQRFKLAKLDPDQEYETLENAIELGLRSIGSSDWKKLLLFITRI